MTGIVWMEGVSGAEERDCSGWTAKTRIVAQRLQAHVHSRVLVGEALDDAVVCRAHAALLPYAKQYEHAGGACFTESRDKLAVVALEGCDRCRRRTRPAGAVVGAELDHCDVRGDGLHLGER